MGEDRPLERILDANRAARKGRDARGRIVVYVVMEVCDLASPREKRHAVAEPTRVLRRLRVVVEGYFGAVTSGIHNVNKMREMYLLFQEFFFFLPQQQFAASSRGSPCCVSLRCLATLD